MVPAQQTSRKFSVLDWPKKSVIIIVEVVVVGAGATMTAYFSAIVENVEGCFLYTYDTLFLLFHKHTNSKRETEQIWSKRKCFVNFNSNIVIFQVPVCGNFCVL